MRDMPRKNHAPALARDDVGVFEPHTGQRAFGFVAPMERHRLFERGYQAMLSNDLTLAKQMFTATVALDPGFADAHMLLGMAFDLTKQADLARRHWQTYLELAPHGPF